MLIAVLILSVVVIIEGYIIVEKEGRIIYLRKRLLRQIRMYDSLKMKLQSESRKRMPIEMTEVSADEEVGRGKQGESGQEAERRICPD